VRCVEARRRMLVYRRVMLRLSTSIAAKHKARFLVVGDSLSQVASQTYENLAATYSGSPTHVFSPLIGLDKKEITRISREIGTFDISALPYGDCCSYFLPKHPELRGTAGLLKDLQEQIDLQTLGDTAIAAARLHEWD
jgi:thiamine biosynthesis protein ThiI